MKKTLGTVALALSAVLAFPANAFAVDTVIPGTLVSEVPHELPAPDVAANDDGVSLVVWLGQDPDVTDADPDTIGDQVCTDEGEYCDIVYSLVDRDGTVITEPDAISAGNVDYYFAAPSVTWNADLGEWLVLMTNYNENYSDVGVFALRIDADGTPIGDLVALPYDRVTPYHDRTEGAIVEVTAADDPAKATAQWSHADQAYLVTWWQEGNNFPFGTGGTGSAAILGVFLDADLSVSDGLDAAFVVSWGSGLTGNTIYADFSEERGEWIAAWWQSSTNDLVYAVITDPQSPDVTDDSIIVDRSDYTVLDSRGYNGDFEWVPSEDKWFVTWAIKVGELNGGEYGVFGQWLSPDGTLSDIQVIDSGAEAYLDAQDSNAEVSIEADRILRQHVELDESTGLLHIVYHKQFFGTPDSQDEDATADGYHIHAFYTIYDPVAEEVVAENVLTEEFPLDSSRPNVDFGPGGLAIVYQDWSNGDWEDPSQVRIYQEPSDGALASTGVETGALSGLAFALLVAGAGVYAVRSRRQA